MSHSSSDTALEHKIADEQRLENLEQRRQELETEFANRRARINDNLRRVRKRLSKRERKRATQRLILTGKAMLALADEQPQIEALINFALNRHLTNKRERAFFDLPPLDAPKPASGSSPTAGAERLFPWLRNLSRLKDTTIRLFSKPS